MMKERKNFCNSLFFLFHYILNAEAFYESRCCCSFCSAYLVLKNNKKKYSKIDEEKKNFDVKTWTLMLAISMIFVWIQI